MPLHQAIELIAFFYFDGKIEQESRFENEMCKTVIRQMKNDRDLTTRSLALCWIFLQAHARDPLGQFVKVTKLFLL